MGDLKGKRTEVSSLCKRIGQKNRKICIITNYGKENQKCENMRIPRKSN